MNRGTANERHCYKIGKWHFRAELLHLERGDTVVKLQPRVSELLLEFVKNAGLPLSREKLIHTVWPKMFIGDEAVSNAIKKLRQSLGDDSHNPQYIETIPKVGYRLIADVHEIEPINNNQIAEVGKSTLSGPSRMWLYFAALVLLTVAAFVLVNSEFFEKTSVTAYPQAESYSIAVLPFKNINKDSSEEYFTDGITTDIITELSRIRSLKVIGRTTVFTYQNQSHNITEIGKELGVRYVVEGSVQKSEHRLRINVHIADTMNGYQLWGEIYDVPVDDLFTVQDELTNRIVDTLALQLTPAEQNNLGRPASRSFEAYESFLQGLEHFRSRTDEGTSAAEEAYKQAIILDPDFARAYGALGTSQIFRYWRGLTDSPNETRDNALTLARKAVALDDQAPQIHWALGFTHLYRREYVRAAAAVNKSLDLAPNYADGHGLSAFIDTHIGEYERAIESINKAVSLNPYYSFEYPLTLGRAYYGLGRYAEAAVAFEKSLEHNALALLPRLFLAATYIRLDRLDDAQWEIEQLQVSAPEFNRAQVVRTIPFKEESELNLLLNDLQLAGLP